MGDLQAIAGIFGAAEQAGGTIGGAIATSEAARARGSVESENAKFLARQAELEAQEAERRGQVAVQLNRMRVQQTLGAQKVAAASQGIEHTGSPLDLRVEAANLGALDALMIQRAAEREAVSRRMEALGLISRGKLAKRTGRSIGRTTLLTGGLQAVRDLSGFIGKKYDAPGGGSMGAKGGASPSYG